MDEIVRAILACQGFVFGGYVRDLLSGDEPKDIDCCIPNRRAFRKKLLKKFGEFTTVKIEDYAESSYSDFYGGSYQRLSLERLIVHGAHKDYQIDIVDKPIFMPDCDVNMLKLGESGITVMDWRLKLVSVLKNIHERRAVVFPTCSTRRKAKMGYKGWDLVRE